jgi:hypothetical protein
MIYIKILDTDGNAASVEALENPVYVNMQARNGIVVRCSSVRAEGILDKTGSVIYQLQGKTPIDRAVATAVVITTAEYYELEATLGTEEDPEDTTPEIPEGTEESEIMTRAQLTEKVNELDEVMALLLSGVTE